ncbi:hypothetical protein N7510_007891 [Penicillium lagena]|uniref:uncharacterized protein n=1 Tax=Penicillium lagena TaxID=94218 RepID=UPI00253F98B2|nr:uncharacterized protein N7510_007891 [Penicillium lagena]KAJ5611172.1 hypothetical protein N7510_007891 [Penicillium lagena]
MATQIVDSLEPRFSLPLSTPLSSKTKLAIGGLQIYVYGLQEANREPNGEVAVLYMAHNRTRTYRVMEDMAHEILHRYQTDKTPGRSISLIAVTMNMRNHGDREVDPQANRAWKDGNENHAMDLISMISGAAQDFKLVVDYLPCYLSQFTRFYNIMAGVSLGAHTAWRIASLASPGQFYAYTMVVGCPNLTDLLLSRLGVDPGPHKQNIDILYQQMTLEQQRRWPRSLAEIVHRDDCKVAKDFPTDVPLLLCNGLHDKLVPAKYTAAWVEERRRKSDQHVTFFVQENTGHSCTKEMVAMIAVWLRDILPVHSPRPFL